MKTAALPTTRSRRLVSGRTKRKTTTSAGVRLARVLVPIDFSERSLEAIEFVLPLLKRLKAELHLVHVFAPDYPLASMAAMPLVVADPEVGRRVRRHLKEVAAKYSLELGRGNIHAVKGRPFEGICDLARNLGVDLIVTSTRGHTGLKHLMLGSTAERVVRYSPCPVLAMHSGGSNGSKPKRQLSFAKILVPIDFSECSFKGLEYAKGLAKRFASKLVLLNSVALKYYITSDEYARYDFPLLMEQEVKNSRRQMRELIENTDWEGIEVTSSLQIGHPGEQICAGADKEGADVIVTSTHGTTGFRHILMGSTAEYVVRHSTHPVLVVPSHERHPLASKET